MFGRRILAVGAFVAAVSAQLKITNPGSGLWWVASSINTLAWDCSSPSSSPTNFNVVLSNSDPSIHITNLALLANIPYYDCSYTVNEQQSALIVSDTWTLSLTSATNITDIYATTQFSVKAAGSVYPTTTAAASGTSSGSAGSPSATSSSKQNGALANYIPTGMGMAAALALGLVVA